ncbi:MAG: leucyl aminopeptidase [Bacillota bacterium]|nr:leucyl aminopeptidase [Bacillota bacterium]
MNVRVVNTSITDVRSDVIIVNLFQGIAGPGAATGAVDRATGGAVSLAVQSGEFEGKLGETLVLRCAGAGIPKAIVVGLGPAAQFTAEKARRAADSAMRQASRMKARTVATIVHGAGIGGLDPEMCARATVEGSLLGAYNYAGFKAKAAEPGPSELLITELDSSKIGSVERGARTGAVMAEAVNLARDLVNAPANKMTPSMMAEAAQSVAQEAGLECRVLERQDMKQLGMGALLGVAQGSAEPPKMVVLKHQGSAGRPALALCGKGLTFDSGGISLKNRDGMELMKDDMAGGAAVIAAMKAIALLKPEVPVLGIVPCTENLPSGTALKPGDVISAMNGKTIEIISTDAEGRLILADAVAYAKSLGATHIVDVATLTGACFTALGDVYSGIVSNSDDLTARILDAAAVAGERFWRFPTAEEYEEKYKSDVADLKNAGDRGAGAITGGLIIGEFCKGSAWAHLDIAGTAFTSSEKGYQPKGATGVAVRTLAQLALDMGR